MFFNVFPLFCRGAAAGDPKVASFLLLLLTSLISIFLPRPHCSIIGLIINSLIGSLIGSVIDRAIGRSLRARQERIG